MPAGRAKREESRFREQAALLARRLRALRRERGVTQEQLAARAQTGVSTIRKIESGLVVEPGYFTVLEIAAALGVPVRFLQEEPPQEIQSGESS